MNKNLEILLILRDYLAKYPDQRFGQALCNLDIIRQEFDGVTMQTFDPYYEEDVKVFDRVTATYNRLLEESYE